MASPPLRPIAKIGTDRATFQRPVLDDWSYALEWKAREDVRSCFTAWMMWFVWIPAKWRVIAATGRPIVIIVNLAHRLERIAGHYDFCWFLAQARWAAAPSDPFSPAVCTNRCRCGRQPVVVHPRNRGPRRPVFRRRRKKKGSRRASGPRNWAPTRWFLDKDPPVVRRQRSSIRLPPDCGTRPRDDGHCPAVGRRRRTTPWRRRRTQSMACGRWWRQGIPCGLDRPFPP